MSPDDSGVRFQAAIARAMETTGCTLDQAVSDTLGEMRSGGFVGSAQPGRTEIHHLDGIEWYKAPIPGRFHRCKRQTWGYVDWFTLIERCACGGLRRDAGRWFERNSRRR